MKYRYRKKVLIGSVVSRLKEIVERIADSFGIEIIEQETDRDHIHILFASRPQIQVFAFVNNLKGVSSRLLRKEFPELKNDLWGDHFWSPSYFLASTGQVSLETLKRYVEEQGHERPSKVKKTGAKGQAEAEDRQRAVQECGDRGAEVGGQQNQAG